MVILIAFTSTLLNQIALVLGFGGTILLAFSSKVGVISKGGQIIFDGLDPMDPVEDNLKHVSRSHWRNRFFTPIGWFLVAASFFLQFVATVLPSPSP